MQTWKLIQNARGDRIKLAVDNVEITHVSGFELRSEAQGYVELNIRVLIVPGKSKVVMRDEQDDKLSETSSRRLDI
jgi:hypothetical protein